MQGEWNLTQELMKLDENLQVVPDIQEETVIRSVTRSDDVSRNEMTRQRSSQNQTEQKIEPLNAEPTIGLS